MSAVIAASTARPALALRSSGVRRVLGSPVAQKQLLARPSRKFVVKAETSTEGSTLDVDNLVKDISAKWDKVENKTSVVVYGVSSIVLLWLASTVVGALNNVPLLPKLFELVGLGYSAWFTYRYLLFKSSREELLEDVETLKKKISGEGQ